MHSDKLVFLPNDGINFDRPTTCKYNLKHVEVGGPNNDTIMALATGSANIYKNTLETGGDSTQVLTEIGQQLIQVEPTQLG